MKNIDTLAFEAHKQDRELPEKYQTPDHYWSDWFEKGYLLGLEHGQNPNVDTVDDRSLVDRMEVFAREFAVLAQRSGTCGFIISAEDETQTLYSAVCTKQQRQQLIKRLLVEEEETIMEILSPKDQDESESDIDQTPRDEGNRNEDHE